MIELLCAGVADADFEDDGAEVACANGVFEMREQLLSEAAAPVFGRDADRRQVGRTVFTDHYKRKRDEISIRRNDTITDRSRLVQKVIERVLGVIIAFSKASDIEPQYFFQMIERQRMDRIRSRRRRGDDLRFVENRRCKKILNCRQNCHIP